MMNYFKNALLFIFLLTSRNLYTQPSFETWEDSTGYRKGKQHYYVFSRSSGKNIILSDTLGPVVAPHRFSLKEWASTTKLKCKNFWKKYHKPIIGGIGILFVTGITYTFLSQRAAYKTLKDENESLGILTKSLDSQVKEKEKIVSSYDTFYWCSKAREDAAKKVYESCHTNRISPVSLDSSILENISHLYFPPQVTEATQDYLEKDKRFQEEMNKIGKISLREFS